MESGQLFRHVLRLRRTQIICVETIYGGRLVLSIATSDQRRHGSLSVQFVRYDTEWLALARVFILFWLSIRHPEALRARISNNRIQQRKQIAPVVFQLLSLLPNHRTLRVFESQLFFPLFFRGKIYSTYFKDVLSHIFSNFSHAIYKLEFIPNMQNGPC